MLRLLKRHDEFTSCAPLISQIRSSIEIAIGKTNDAIKTQEKYINNLITDKQGNKIRLNMMNISDKNLKITHDEMERDHLEKISSTIVSTEGSIINVPDEFICSITWEIMTDPVICSDGNTYEREAIEEWFYTNDTSPKTNMPLDDNKLIPNRALKYLIDAWKLEHHYDEHTIIHTDHNQVITEEINETKSDSETEQEQDIDHEEFNKLIDSMIDDTVKDEGQQNKIQNSITYSV